MMNKLERMAENVKREVTPKLKIVNGVTTTVNGEAGSDANSDITAKAVSDVADGKSVSLRQMHEMNGHANKGTGR